MRSSCLVWALLASLLLLLPAVSASISNYDLSLSVAGGKVEADHQISVSGTDELKIRLPSSFSDLYVSQDGKEIKPDVEGNSLSLPGSGDLNIIYASKQYLDKENIVFDFISPSDIPQFKLTITLPENTVLKNHFSQGDLTTGSVYPSPSKALTDGKSIVLVWERQFDKGDELPVFVSYKKSKNYLSLIIILALLAVGIAMHDFFKRSKKEVVIEKEDMVEKHLKEDEEQIVNIIKQREGHQIEQGTLRVVTGFPKATLSRVLKELEERKVIYKEKRGKKNLVFLKK